jgi:hypothetical protein
MDIEYTGFVHLLGPNGALVAQDDQPPRNGFLPTTIWQPDLIISDRYTIVVPLDAETGTYSLVAGMYDLASGERLPVSQDGMLTGDSVLLGRFEVH